MCTAGQSPYQHCPKSSLRWRLIITAVINHLYQWMTLTSLFSTWNCAVRFKSCLAIFSLINLFCSPIRDKTTISDQQITIGEHWDPRNGHWSPYSMYWFFNVNVLIYFLDVKTPMKSICILCAARISVIIFCISTWGDSNDSWLFVEHGW